MKFSKFLWLLLGVFLSLRAGAQYNPANPPEPNEPNFPAIYRLTVVGTPQGAYYSITSSRDVEVGTKVSLSVSTNYGYNFLHWESSDGFILSTSRSFTYVMPEHDVTVTAVMEYSPANPSEPSVPKEYSQLSLSVYPSGAGSVSGAGKYEVGTNRTVYAYANSGFRFKNWTRDGEEISDYYYFSYRIRSGSNNLVANFEYDPSDPSEPSVPVIKRTLTLKVTPYGAGSVSPSSGGSYQAGSTVSLSARAYSNYTFDAWEDVDGNVLSNSANLSYKMPDANTTLTARFRYTPGAPSEPGAVEPRRNVIYGSRISVAPGSTVYFDVNLENTDLLTGLNFDIAMPEGFVADYANAVTTSRTDSYLISMSEADGAMRFMLRGSTPIQGGSGAVLRIPVAIPADVEKGSAVEIPMSHGVVITASGAQNAVDAIDGILKVEDEFIAADSPDFVVTDLDVASASLMPGDALSVSWKVKNQGNIAATGGWSESVSLVSGDNKRLTLATVYYDTDTLAPGESVDRSALVAIPDLPGIDGPLNVRIDLVPYAVSGEADANQLNNITATTHFPVSLGKVLSLEVPGELDEGVDAVRCSISRSGSWSESESFALRVSEGDDRLVIPESVTVPRGQSTAFFTLRVADNDKVDESGLFTIEASGNGYPAVSASINVTDNDFSQLAVEASNDDLVEGDSFELLISTPSPVKSTVTVYIVSDLPARFRHPSSAVIPAGESSVAVTVQTVDDDDIHLPASAEFTVTADGFDKASCIVDIIDNDIPELALTFTPSVVSESAGPAAIVGRLARLSNNDKKITVRLSDNSPKGDIYYTYRSLTLERGVDFVEFPIGVVDNAVVDGDRKVEITAAVYVQSCSCSPSGTDAGVVSETITIIDDDGPALTLMASSTTLLEGDSNGIVLTVSRNTDTSKACTVTVSSDFDEGLSYNSTVIIPKGDVSASVKVTAKANDTSDDDRTIVFSAESEGYSRGICWVMLSDRTLPDAVVESFKVSADEVEVGQPVSVSLTVANRGAAPLDDAVRINVYAEGVSAPLASLFTSEVLPAGDSVNLSCTLTPPSSIGRHALYAVVNEAKSEKELLYTNNTSKRVTVVVLSPFRASVASDKALYQRGEEILFTGHVDGTAAPGDEVEVYVLNEGLRQTITAVIDNSNDFTARFIPFSGQMGHFIAGACYPGENSSEEAVSFDIIGLKAANNSYITHRAYKGEPVAASISLSNPSAVALTGIKAQITAKPDNFDISVSCPSSLEAGGSMALSYTLKGTSLSRSKDWDIAKVRVETAEGASYETTLYLYCMNSTGKIETSIDRIKTTMTYDQPRDYSFTITNTGKGETGVITLALPDWMKPITPVRMASLAHNDSTDVVLRLTPTESMQLNVPVTGQIGINCENGEGMALQFSVEPVSETTGTLVVDVCDEFTYYTAEAPHVEGAEVSVLHPVSYAVLAKGTTGKDGLYSITLPEGYYRVKVTCPRHESYQGLVVVDPGTETIKVVDISASNVEVSFRVVETEVEDEYTIETTYTYDAEVPAPVVTITQDSEVNGQNMAVGESKVINIIVTNEGLIAALDVTLDDLVSADNWNLEFLGDAGPFDLPAKQSRVVPLKVTRIAADGPASIKRRLNQKISPCMGGFNEYSKYKCGRELKESRRAYTMALEICAHSGALNDIMTALASAFGGNGGWGGGPGSPGGGGGGGYYSDIDNHNNVGEEDPLICDDDALGCADGIVKGLGGSHPLVGPIIGATSDVGNAMANNKADQDGVYVRPRVAPHAEGGSPLFKPTDGMRAGGWMAIGAGASLRDPSGLLNAGINAGRAAIACAGFIAKQNSRHAPAKAPSVPYSQEERLNAYIDQLSLARDVLIEFYGDEIWFSQDMDPVIDFFNKAAALPEEEITFENLLPFKPEHVSAARLAALLERLEGTNPDNVIDEVRFIEMGDRLKRVEDDALLMGYESSADMYESTLREIYADLSNPAGSVCSKVKLKISQSMVMTRQAFRGILDVSNGSADTPLKNVALTLVIRDDEGNVATSHEFQTNLESLDGFTGAQSLDGPWELAPKADGTVTVIFIPTRYAAEKEPRDYTFSGVLYYTDPYTGLDVTRELSSTTLTVNPSPVLNLTYFMQKDVYGDDPFTKDVVEPTIPGEFALVIDNIGYGDAKNVRISTRQPEIIENEKGLLVDFELVGSQVNGKDYNLALGGTVLSDFGTIPALSSAYAQWWLACPLLGHFSSYDVSVNHVSSYGNEDLSLINSAEIHELIHGFTVDDAPEITVRGFLANDIADADFTPDAVYFSDGTPAASVAQASSTSVARRSETEFVLSAAATADGWIYGSLSDPTGGRQEIVSVTRLGDGADIPADNFWQTPYTIRSNQLPVHENLLHFVTRQTGSEAYLLTFEPRPDEELEVEAFLGVPEEGTVLKEPLKSVTVVFNKPVLPDSFTGEDVTLFCQGARADVSDMGITPIDERTFLLDLDGLTRDFGFYVLTVNTSGINDTEGFSGTYGKSVSWIQDIPNVAPSLESSPVAVYPVPMAGDVYISGNYGPDNILEFYDSEGRLCLQKRSVSPVEPVNVSDLAPGVYIIRLVNGSYCHILKAVKK